MELYAGTEEGVIVIPLTFTENNSEKGETQLQSSLSRSSSQ